MINFQSKNSTRALVCIALASIALPLSSQVGFSAASQDPKANTSGATLAAPLQAAPAQATTKQKNLRYLRVGSNGAKARNLGDANGVSIADLSAGTLVAVYEERGDWLECEVPGGFEIWVYGQFVKASSEAGVLEITGSEVRARPLASSGPESYPLQPNLSKGDRVRLIKRNDATKPLAEDWVKVYSPPGVRGFVAKGECEALTPGMDGAAAWSSAVVESRKRAPLSALPAATPAAAATGEAIAAGFVGELTPQQAIEELKRADAALARERAVANPELAGVRAQYQLVFDSTKAGATKEMAKHGLAEVDALIEAHAIKGTLQAERDRAEQDNLKREAALAKAAKNKDLYSGRFDSRGWVEKRTLPGQKPTFMVRWGGNLESELICNSGRYDLSAFNGYEIGINGRELRSFTPGDISHVAVPRLIDAARIEVISGRQTR